MSRAIWVLTTLLVGMGGCAHAQTRGQAADDSDKEDPVIKNVKLIGHVTEVGGWRPIPVSGVGLVMNLEGTGGGVPPGEYRKMLIDQLQKRGVKNAAELLADSHYTMVTVNALIHPGARKGDWLDVEVFLPQQSKATSLRGGYLVDCPLFNFEVMQNNQGSSRLLKGHILAKANGPLLVGVGEGQDHTELKRGKIWQGAESDIDAPFVLVLKNDQKFASVANMVANRINAAFPDDARKQQLVRQSRRLLVLDEVATGINEKFSGANGLGRGEAAHTSGKDAIYVKVPMEYRLNPERYLRVIRLIPLRDSPEALGKYRHRLREMLLDPKDCVRAALRLEAIGKESLPALQEGLKADFPLVRFASAEALAYLGSTAGVEELGRLAAQHATLRGHCLTALASLNEIASHGRLAQLMQEPAADLRIGAFRALVSLAEAGASSNVRAMVGGELLNESFWLHRVASVSSPLVHISTQRRAEIVIFGEPPTLLPPYRITAGAEFVVAAAAGDQRCLVTRYAEKAGKANYKQCSFEVGDILRTMASMGGQYPEAIELLRQADRDKCLTAAIMVDAFPVATPIEVVAACGSDAWQFKDNPAFQQDVVAAQEDLGMLARPANPVVIPTGAKR